MKRLLVILTTLAALLALPASAAETPSAEELAKRVRDLEEKIEAMQKAGSNPALDEIRRQIEILSKEIETLKVNETPAIADTQQFGLGAAASKVYRVESGLSLGGYGEMLYEGFDSRRDDGAASGKRDQLDFLRAVLYTGYKFSDRVIFNSELEYEHATTGEGAGEVSVEFAYLDFMMTPAVNARAGLLLVPMGLLNELHEPTAFFGARRPDVERLILPTTWRENGAGLFGDIGPITWRAYAVTGLRSDKFSSTGIRNARQKGARAEAEDFALVGRVDYKPFEGMLFGGSIYSGSSSQGRRTPAGERFDARVTIGEVHADVRVRGLTLRALWADGSIGDARQVNLANNLTGRNSIGEAFGGWYAEAGYELGGFLPRQPSLSPFARYERLDTQEEVPAGFLRNPERDVEVLTLGLAFKPISQTVIKAEYQNIDNEGNTGVDQFNLALGYIF